MAHSRSGEDLPGICLKEHLCKGIRPNPTQDAALSLLVEGKGWLWVAIDTDWENVDSRRMLISGATPYNFVRGTEYFRASQDM